MNPNHSDVSISSQGKPTIQYKEAKVIQLNCINTIIISYRHRERKDAEESADRALKKMVSQSKTLLFRLERSFR